MDFTSGFKYDYESEKGASAFIQLSSRHRLRKGAARRGSPEDLLKLDPGKRNPFKPEAKAFTTHEGGAIETFHHLEEGWAADKLSDEEKETNALFAYKLAKQARDSAIAAAQGVKGEKESLKSDAESEKATADADRTETQRILEGDSTALDNVDKECRTKAQEYEERVKIR